MSPLLAVTNISKRFGGLIAVNQVTLSASLGRITGLIGPNGAGKSTLFNCLTGMTTPDTGSVYFDGHEVIQSPPATIQSTLNRIWLSQLLWCLIWPLAVLLIFLPTVTADLADFEILCICYLAAGVRILGAFHLKRRRTWTWAMHGALAGADAALASVAAFRVTMLSFGSGLIPYPDVFAFSIAPEWSIPYTPLLWTAVSLTTINALWLFYQVGQKGVRAALNIHPGPHKINAFGLARTFQNIRLFNELTVLDNVRIGAHLQGSSGLTGALLRVPKFKREEQDLTNKATAAIERVGLTASMMIPAGSLSYGQQRRLEIARALAGAPKALLLDEPAAGMNHSETAELAELLTSLRDEGLAILLIEHDMRLMMNICDEMVVLNHGSQIANGAPQDIRQNKAVIEAYLGEGAST